MDEPVVADQQELTSNISVRTQVVAWKTCRPMDNRDGWREERVREILANLMMKNRNSISLFLSMPR